MHKQMAKKAMLGDTVPSIIIPKEDFCTEVVLSLRLCPIGIESCVVNVIGNLLTTTKAAK